ncbi:MAG TPA: extracellular solute-binding protein [Luteimicrobium sp.]|jgi:ABC-type glycerol-3-phosphate transport system substrate-binding protein|nr:extracellular solute-binding protein [Luteimicrobium sp.]
MTRKNLAAVGAVAVVAATCLTACSSSSSDGGSDSTAGGTVTYMTWESNPTNAAFDKTMATFTSTSGVTVKREAAPNADYAQKLASMILSKKAPDFFWCTPAQAQNLAAEGLLYDWSKKLDAGTDLKAEDFSPGSLDLWKTPKGALAGIPTLANTYGFFYNADTFKKAGIEVPKIGWTWDDLFSDIKKLKEKDPATTPLVAQWPLLDATEGVSAYSVANGGEPLVDSFVTTTKVSADATIHEGAQRFVDAIAAKQMTSPDYDATNAMAAFSNGKIPLMFGGQWLNQMISPNKPKFDWGYAPWPVGTAKNVQPIETNGVCSPASLKNPDATWKAIAYLETTGFNESMEEVPVAPIAYTPGTEGYYKGLEAQGGAAAASIEATAKYELAATDKFNTSFLDPWAVKEADIEKTSWNPMLLGKKSVDQGIDETVAGIQGLIGK